MGATASVATAVLHSKGVVMTDRSVTKQLCNCLDNECHANLPDGWACRKAALTSKNETRWSVMLWRSLDRLHRAVKGCARIGFQESSPTTNASHAEVWNYLNEAQSDAALKLDAYSKLSGDSSAPETSAPQPPSLTLEQSVFNADGSRDWYAPAWSTRTTIASKLYIPMELLAAALGFLKRARYFTPEGSGELTDEINAYLSTFGIERAGHTPQCSSQETSAPLTPAEMGTVARMAAVSAQVQPEKASDNCPTGDYPCEPAKQTTTTGTPAGHCIYCGRTVNGKGES